ncbi:MAG: hypothetical protein ABMA14_24300, partial [Hyphomonadaceae bacterium]
MKLKSSLVASLLGRNRGPQIDIAGDHLLLREGLETRRIPLNAVHDVSVARAGFWTDVKLQTADASWVVPGAAGSSANRFRQQLVQQIVTDGIAALRCIEPGLVIDEIDQLFGRDLYLARHDVQEWSRDLGSKHSIVAVAIDFLRRPAFSKNLSI